MISSKREYKEYLEKDRHAREERRKRPRFLLDDEWRFQRLLRKTEYVNNCSHSKIGKIYLLVLRYRLHRSNIRLGYTIPLNIFGPGLYLAHHGTLVINRYARVGANCKIHVGVNIGGKGGFDQAPDIGDNVYIGPGVKIFGKIKIGNNVTIGSNSVVNRDVPDNCVIAGVPAKIIKHNGKRVNISLKDYWNNINTQVVK